MLALSIKPPPPPPAQPGEADADTVDLEHDVLPPGIAVNRDAVGQEGAGWREEEAVDVDGEGDDVPPLNFIEEIDLGLIGQAKKNGATARPQ